MDSADVRHGSTTGMGTKTVLVQQHAHGRPQAGIKVNICTFRAQSQIAAKNAQSDPTVRSTYSTEGATTVALAGAKNRNKSQVSIIPTTIKTI